MAKVTSKYQVTVPKAIAERYHIRPGDRIDWVPAGDVIRVIPSSQHQVPEDRETRLRYFDLATERQRKRRIKPKGTQPEDRGWQREDLYRRGRSH